MNADPGDRSSNAVADGNTAAATDRVDGFLQQLAPLGFTHATAARLALTEASLAQSYPKVFRTGTDRVFTPEQTLERVWPLAEQAGVTRLADITGLDTIGIPVYSAIRPLAKNLSVSSGKGATHAAARASAVMESLEGWHSELHQVEVIEASVAQLRAAGAPLANIERIERYDGIELDLDAPMRFVAGFDLVSASARLVPYELVHGDFSLPYHASEGVFQCGSNGLASGNVLSEAVVHALYELIERESLRSGAYDTAPDEPGMFGVSSTGARRIDLSTIADPLIAAQVTLFADAGIDIALVDCTTDLGVPAVVAMAHVARDSERNDNVINPMPFMAGAGTHLSRTIAASRAITEAAQDRAVVTAGSRDDLPRYIYTEWEAQSLFVKMVLGAPATVSFADLPDRANQDLRDDLVDATSSVAQQGFDEIVVVDLSLTDAPMNVVQVVVPGMRLMEPPGPPPRPMPHVPTDEPDGVVGGLELDALRRTGIAVFCGPTLPGNLGRDQLDAAWLPPAECGDIWRAVRAGAHTIVLIDGRYSTVPAPWHKEILWALANNVRVIGAASMGAMRAAELAPFGMTGIGKVFEMYVGGVIDGDDEVAIVHASVEHGYRQLSDALVDVRVLVAEAVNEGVISAEQAARVVEAVRAEFYPFRSLNAAIAALDEPFASALSTFASPRRLRQKQADALAALAAVDTVAAPVSPPFVDTWIWGLLVRTEQSWPER